MENYYLYQGTMKTNQDALDEAKKLLKGKNITEAELLEVKGIQNQHDVTIQMVDWLMNAPASLMKTLFRG